MKKIIKPLVTLFLIINSSANLAEEFAPDPYQSIEFIKLDNGMSVYFSPSEDTNLTSIRLEVDVGWEIENKTNWGVSHLLEHVLFRDKQLKEEMSYLQIIKEAGGSANGTTENRKTSFFGSIPYSKGSWLLENFSKMILEPKIINEYVQKEKSTVELEIGRPGP
ncbi:MAG: insulinase family protein, partial [Bacteriovorax sp.]